jgi:cytochrome c oxidase cbb3-type subunit 1
VIGKLILGSIVLVIAILIILIRLNSYITQLNEKRKLKQSFEFSDALVNLEVGDIDSILERGKQSLKFKFKGKEFGGGFEVLAKNPRMRPITLW